jgi:hypothetical protein
MFFLGIKNCFPAGGRWLMPIILAIQEDRGSKPAWANSSERPHLEETHHKKGLMEWLKV